MLLRFYGLFHDVVVNTSSLTFRLQYTGLYRNVMIFLPDRAVVYITPQYVLQHKMWHMKSNLVRAVYPGTSEREKGQGGKHLLKGSDKIFTVKIENLGGQLHHSQWRHGLETRQISKGL